MSRYVLDAKWGTRALVVFVLLALGLFGLGGCSDNAVSNDNTTTFNEQGALDNILEADALGDGYEDGALAKPKTDQAEGLTAEQGELPPYLTASGTAKFDPNGFSIVLDFGVGGLNARFDFPPVAVDPQTLAILVTTGGEISIAGEAVLCNGSYTFFYECGPHGLVFDNPVELHQGVRENNLVPMGLFYNVRGPWYRLEEVGFVRNGRVDFSIWHFSKYGVSR